MKRVCMGPIPITILLVVALAYFARSLWVRLGPLRNAKRHPGRLRPFFARAKSVLVYGLGQRRMVDDLIPGLLHIFIFAGFMAVSVRTVALIGLGFSTDGAF